MLKSVKNCNFHFIRNKHNLNVIQPKIEVEELKVKKEFSKLNKPVSAAPKSFHSSSTYDELISKFVGIITKNGQRDIARSAIQKTMAEIKCLQITKLKSASDEEKKNIVIDPFKIFHKAVENCTPLLILQKVRHSCFIYKVPAPPQNEIHARHMAIKLIMKNALNKNPKERIWFSLSRELVAASNNTGKSVEMKRELHKVCEQNRAYANYRKF